MLATLKRCQATFERAAGATAKVQKIADKITSWGENTGDESEMVAVQRLIAEGFVPPKSTRSSKVEFAEGQTVALKDEFATPYLSLYSEEEIHSLKFSFFDPVNKVAMLESDGRFVAAKMKHLEARA